MFLKEWCDEIVYLERSITLLFTSVNLNVHKKTLQPTCMWDWIFLIVKHWIPKSKWGSSFCHFQGVSIQKFHKGVTQVSISQAQDITSKTVCVVTSPIIFLTVHKDCRGCLLILLPIPTFRQRSLSYTKYQEIGKSGTCRNLNVTHIIHSRWHSQHNHSITSRVRVSLQPPMSVWLINLLSFDTQVWGFQKQIQLAGCIQL